MKKKKKGNNVIIFRAGFNKFRPFSTRTSSSADHYDGPECRVDFFFFFFNIRARPITSSRVNDPSSPGRRETHCAGPGAIRGVQAQRYFNIHKVRARENDVVPAGRPGRANPRGRRADDGTRPASTARGPRRRSRLRRIYTVATGTTLYGL